MDKEKGEELSLNEDTNWQAIVGLVAEMKKCFDVDIPTAAIAMAFVCIDTVSGLGRSGEKQKATRSDFKCWVDKYLKGHPDQPYQYRGVDVYASRCALLHTYGAKSGIHDEGTGAKIFIFHDGGKHFYRPEVDNRTVIIGTASFINDVAHGVTSFMEDCFEDPCLRDRVQARLGGVFQIKQFPVGDNSD